MSDPHMIGVIVEPSSATNERGRFQQIRRKQAADLVEAGYTGRPATADDGWLAFVARK